jgi:uncharacterized protein
MKRAVLGILVACVRAYQLTIAPWLPPSCRYVPSCSAYMIEALRLHGPWRGTMLGLRRIGRCHPWGGKGFDPPPPRRVGSAGASPQKPSRAPPGDSRGPL